MALDAEELANFREFALPYMTTHVEVFRPRIRVEDGPAYVPEDDLGDDELYPSEPPTAYAYSDDLPVYPYGDDGPVWAGYGWMYSHIQQNVSEGSGQLGTIDIHEIRLPVTAVISPMDLVRILASNEVFVVVDTNAEDTISDMLRCSLRRRQ